MFVLYQIPKSAGIVYYIIAMCLLTYRFFIHFSRISGQKLVLFESFTDFILLSFNGLCTFPFLFVDVSYFGVKIAGQ